MRLLAYVESPEHVCCRYRLRAFERGLAEAGHTLEYAPQPRRFVDRLRMGRELRPGDVAIVQRKLLPGWQVALLRRRASRLIFDLDDAVWLRDSFSGRGFHSARRARRFRSICAAADAVVAGNGYLAEHAREAGARNAVVIPTCVEASRYTPAVHAESPTVELVWIGSSSTLQGVEQVASALESLADRVPNLRLKVICDRFPTFARLPVVACPWDAATEAAELASSAVGISWIPDDPWSRGKCGLKVLQYMAAGLPVVANPVGVHPEMVEHGVTGFLAETPQQWAAAVRALAADRDLRRRMGAAGRARFEAAYSVERGLAAWLGVLGEWAAPSGPLAPASGRGLG